MKRALLIGINDYDNFNSLNGCVNDVLALESLLSHHANSSLNFECRPLVTKADCTRANVRQQIDALFSPGAEVALFYFAGHGVALDGDVAIVTADATDGDMGIKLGEIIGKVRATEAIIILDCCFAGNAGGAPLLAKNVTMLPQGTSCLLATRGDQTAEESPDDRGLFSTYLCAALDGGAADVLGKVTAAGMYAYLSESFGAWQQRPMFKANVDKLHEIRLCAPAVPVEHLRRLPEFFRHPTDDLALDPSFEPDALPKHPTNESIFAILQECRAAKLVEPVGASHLYYAAMNSKACRLTPLGKHYWHLASQKRL
jgi:hypothetical protein